VKRRIVALLSLSLLLTAIALSNYFFFRHDQAEDIVALCRLTQSASPVWNVSWHEPRLRRYQKPIYTPYPEFPAADRLGLIYRSEGEP
jgi:hypothetical protein